MPMDKKMYPDNWEAIALEVKKRAAWRCDFYGVPHGAVGARDRQLKWHDEQMIEGVISTSGIFLFGTAFPQIIEIVLTAAHLGIDK